MISDAAETSLDSHTLAETSSFCQQSLPKDRYGNIEFPIDLESDRKRTNRIATRQPEILRQLSLIGPERYP